MTDTTKGTFALQIKEFAEKASNGFDKVIKTTLLDLSRRVIMRTPVGNPDLWLWKNADGVYVDYIAWKGYPEGYVGGQARANWQSSVGNPAAGVVESVDAKGSATLKKINVSEAPGSVWWLTNNLPYIQRLEYDGWSTQAPEGMVRVTLTELDESIRQAIADLPR